MGEHEIRLEGIAGRITLTEPGLFRGSRLLVDGKPPERGKRGRFRLLKRDGSYAEARLVSGFSQYVPALEVDGVRHQVGEKLPGYLAVLSFLPFCLVFVGGAVGGLLGGAAWAFNNQIARTSMSTLGKVVVMLAVTGAAVVGYLVTVSLIQMAFNP